MYTIIGRAHTRVGLIFRFGFGRPRTGSVRASRRPSFSGRAA